MSYELTILMPCLNESETLATCIKKATHFLQTENIHGEILIADNGSTDGSKAIAKSLGAKVISVTTQGYGAALKSGIQHANGRYIIMGDADDSYDFQNIHVFLQKLKEGHDLVMGNRFRGGIMQGAMPFLNRYLGNPLLSLIGRIFFKSKIGDFHCGLRGFHREKIKDLNLQCNGMEFASEMVVKAALNKLKITEVPTRLFPDGRNRRPHLRPWRDGWRHLCLLFLLSPRWLFFYPGLLLLTLGFVLMLLLLPAPLKIHGINLDIQTMLLCSVFMIIGLQAVFFAYFSKNISTFHMKNDAPYHASLFKKIKFQHVLVIAFLLLVTGGSGFFYTFIVWAKQSFGPLIPTKMMRILIPSVTAITLSIQLVFASFFMKLVMFHLQSITSKE